MDICCYHCKDSLLLEVVSRLRDPQLQVGEISHNHIT